MDQSTRAYRQLDGMFAETLAAIKDQTAIDSAPYGNAYHVGSGIK